MFCYYVHVPYEAYVPPQGARRPVLSYRVLASTGYWHYNLKRDAAHSMDAASRRSDRPLNAFQRRIPIRVSNVKFVRVPAPHM
jgi:hypothetical protein